jgi:hypothetical protein
VGPGKSIFDAISRAVGKINLIAEDLVSFIRYTKKKKKKKKTKKKKRKTLKFSPFSPLYLDI